jgi:hypothetical protein
MRLISIPTTVPGGGIVISRKYQSRRLKPSSSVLLLPKFTYVHPSMIAPHALICSLAILTGCHLSVIPSPAPSRRWSLYRQEDCLGFTSSLLRPRNHSNPQGIHQGQLPERALEPEGPPGGIS